MKQEYDLNCSMIVSGTRPLYADYNPQHSERLGTVLEDLDKEFNQIEKYWDGKRYLIFTVSCTVGENDDEATTPLLRYRLN